MGSVLVLMASVSGAEAQAKAKAGPRQTMLVDGTAAYVNEHAVTVGDVMVAMGSKQRQLVSQLRDKAALRKALNELYSKTLKDLIDRRLVVDAYATQERQIPEEAIDAHIDSIANDMFGSERTPMLDVLKQDGLTMEEWRTNMREHVIFRFMRSGVVDRNVAIPPRRVREEYERRRDDFREAAQVRPWMIVLPVDAEGADAATMRKRVLDGKDSFANLAREHSSGSHADKGGDWGWVDPEMLHRKLRKVLAGLKSGEIASPIQLGKKVYLVKLEGRKAAGTRRFADVQQEIENDLRDDETNRLFGEWVQVLKKRSYVKQFNVNPFDEI